MAVFDAANRLLSATPEAIAWFEGLESGYRLHDAALDVDVPSEVIVAALDARVRAAADRARRRRAPAPARAAACGCSSTRRCCAAPTAASRS